MQLHRRDSEKYCANITGARREVNRSYANTNEQPLFCAIKICINMHLHK